MEVVGVVSPVAVQSPSSPTLAAVVQENCPNVVPKRSARSAALDGQSLLEGAASILSRSVQREEAASTPPMEAVVASCETVSPPPEAPLSPVLGPLPTNPVSPPLLPAEGPAVEAVSRLRYMREELIRMHRSRVAVPPAHVARWKEMDLYVVESQALKRVKPPSGDFCTQPVVRGFGDFSRSQMKSVFARALDTLDNKSDNKFIVVKPAERQDQADKKIQV